MKNVFLIFVLSLVGLTQLKAQFKVTGVIIDNKGVPIPGVNITEKGTNNGNIADANGKYAIEVVSADATLSFTFIGYETIEIEVNNQSVIDVVMRESTSALDEIIVVGYGVQSKKDATGSIATVSAEAITERSNTNISNALQGAVAGLSVTRSGNVPGAGNTVLIRGTTTLQGSSTPLFLVDDVPVSSLNVVSPDQVKSITVLKDGAAAAIYGSRAAAGVIIVTTKRAKEGAFQATYNGEYFINTPTMIRKTVGPVRYMENINERLWNESGNGDNQFIQYSKEQIEAYKNGEHLRNRDLFPYTDWANLLLKNNATGTRHTLSFSGGTKLVKSSLSVNYETQNALYNFRDWTRYTVRANNDIKITNKIGALADLSLRLVKNKNPGIDPTAPALVAAPVFNAFHQDGRLAGGRNGENPYARLQSGSFATNDTYNYYGRLGIYYKPINELKIALNFAPNVTFTKGKSFTKPVPFWGVDDVGQVETPSYILNVDQARMNESRGNTNIYTKQALVSYNKSLDKNNINAVLGYEDYTSYRETLGVRAIDFLSPDFPYLNQAPTDKVFNNGTSISEVAYASGFGRVNYNFDNKYYASVSLRYDGSSRFASDYRWGSFPSFSAAWTVSNEEFMKSFKSPISFLKLKGSYGVLGNDRFGNYLYITDLQVENTLIPNGSGSAEEVRAISQRFLTTPDIKWESTVTANFGIELGLFKDRLLLDGEYFQKSTADMLLKLSVPDLVGFEDPTVNVGSMETTGWEVSVRWSDQLVSDFNYSVSFNISDAISVIGDINKKRRFDGNTLSEEGSNFRELYGLLSDGLYQTEEELINSPVTSEAVGVGDVRYRDISGPDGVPDGIINDFDRTFLGSSRNHYIFGGRINMDYKGFDLAMAFQGVGKRNFILSKGFLYRNPDVERLTVEYADNYWSHNKTAEQNANALYPKYSVTSQSNNFRFSDYQLRNGAYLRLKSLTLGYTFSGKIIAKSGLSKIRVYVTGTDLFTFDYLPDGVDPELTSGTAYYITSSIIFGLKVSI